MSLNAAALPLKGKEKRFHSSQLVRLDPERIPHHIAIIPDGNRRWAKKRLHFVQQGHRAGADTLMDIVNAAQEIGVQIITFYSFSTENWSRPEQEVWGLLTLFANYLLEQRDEMIQNGVKLETIGDTSKFPSHLREIIYETKEATRHCSSIRLILALNYGARDELCRAFKAMLHDYDHNYLNKDEITEQTISRYLDTCEIQDPDLLIRTSGESRLSNFLLWQIQYTEVHIASVLWPDFTPENLLEAIVDYQNRMRRWGGD